MKLVLATRNKGKVDEIRAALALPSLELISLAAFPGAPEVVEDGETFESNAVKKAVTIARATGHWALADDSGLEVDALGGAPGVHSARYAGEGQDHAANNAKLLKALHGVANRAAAFRCVIALSSPAGLAKTVSGSCRGRIILNQRGSGGFGYDPVFVPNGHEKTFAELSIEVKNGMSHRGRALRAASEAWRATLASGGPDWQD